MSLIEMYKTGGPFMHLISIFALLALIVSVLKVLQITSKKEFNLRLLDLVLLSGSVSLAIGLLSQIIGIMGALSAIAAAGDISPKLVMDGAKVSFYAPVWGFIVFIFSLIIYFVLKEIIKSRN